MATMLVLDLTLYVHLDGLPRVAGKVRLVPDLVASQSFVRGGMHLRSRIGQQTLLQGSRPESLRRSLLDSAGQEGGGQEGANEQHTLLDRLSSLICLYSVMFLMRYSLTMTIAFLYSATKHWFLTSSSIYHIEPLRKSYFLTPALFRKVVTKATSTNKKYDHISELHSRLRSPCPG